MKAYKKVALAQLEIVWENKKKIKNDVLILWKKQKNNALISYFFQK